MSTLASNSLLEVVTFAAVDAEKHVDDSLVQIFFIALLNLSVLGFSFLVFYDKAKRTQQGNLLGIIPAWASDDSVGTEPPRGPDTLLHIYLVH